MKCWIISVALVALMAFCVSGLFVLLPDEYEGLSGWAYFVGLAGLIYSSRWTYHWTY